MPVRIFSFRPAQGEGSLQLLSTLPSLALLFIPLLLGSCAVAGLWDEDWWDLRDRNGTTLKKAFTAFGLDHRLVGDAARTPEELVGYLEAHIEQGPYLEAADRSLGYVTTIAGARRFRLSVIGEARHAGGTPYPRRKDALVGASLAIAEIGRASCRERVFTAV